MLRIVVLYLKAVHGSFGGVIMRKRQMVDFVRVDLVKRVACVGSCGILIRDLIDAAFLLSDTNVDNVGGIGADGPLQRMRSIQPRL